MDLTMILPPRMTPVRGVHAAMAFAVIAWCGALPTAHAQYGTPEEWRRSAPTIADRDPGVAPAPGEDVMDAAYHRQPVFYRTEESPARSSSIRPTASST